MSEGIVPLLSNNGKDTFLADGHVCWAEQTTTTRQSQMTERTVLELIGASTEVSLSFFLV